MALDRWIALIILLIALLYGYTAFFSMDESLPPFMQRNPVWPSTFPKILSVLTIVCALIIVLGLEKNTAKPKPAEINYRRLTEYKLGQALLLLGLMVVYALTLRPVGFIVATVTFLTLGSAILGERKFYQLIPIAVGATLFVWYLVDKVLGIFLSPLPAFLSSGG